MGDNCPGGSCPGWNYSGVIVWGAKVRGVIVLGGNCPGRSCPGGIVIEPIIGTSHATLEVPSLGPWAGIIK